MGFLLSFCVDLWRKRVCYILYVHSVTNFELKWITESESSIYDFIFNNLLFGVGNFCNDQGWNRMKIVPFHQAWYGWFHLKIKIYCKLWDVICNSQSAKEKKTGLKIAFHMSLKLDRLMDFVTWWKQYEKSVHVWNIIYVYHIRCIRVSLYLMI